MKKFDIFISYRREGGYETAKHLFDLLVRDGYTVSFDIDTLRNGKFDKTLLNRIEDCQDFIVILNKGAFSRTINPFFKRDEDWLRIELAEAIRLQKNIIPIILPDFKSFPLWLPSDVKDIKLYNGPIYNKNYFDEFYDNLKRNFITSHKDIIKDKANNINVVYKYAFNIGFLIAGRRIMTAMGHYTESDDIKNACAMLDIDYNLILDKEKEPDPNAICKILGIKYDRVCEDVLDLGYNLFLFSYMKTAEAKGKMEEAHNAMLKNTFSKLLLLMKRTAIPQHFINKLENLNSSDACISYRDSLRIYFENRNECVKKCPICGSTIALDYKECPFCESILNSYRHL